MRKKDFIRIINEEISNFDFLSNDMHLKEKELLEILESEDFQKQFIIDAITKFKEKITLDNSDAEVTDVPIINDTLYRDDEFIEYPARIIYEFDEDKDPITFDVTFNTNGIDLEEVDVSMFSKHGDDIDFAAFKKAPKKIQELFIETFVKPIIENRGDEKPFNSVTPHSTSVFK